MRNYYVNDTAQPNGDHEIHKEGCLWLSLAASTTHLGKFRTYQGAVIATMAVYHQVNGCVHCSRRCHTE